MKILKSVLNYIPLATFIIFVVTDGIFSLTSALIFVISTIGLLINWKRKKQRWRIEKIPVFETEKSKFVEGEVMGLLERLKLNKTKDFFEWLDLILKNELNSEIKAINFNLYEDTDNKWSVELVGTFSFDKDNDDWACDEVFTTRDQPFVIECESDWELVETFFISLVNEYLSSGKYAGKLKEYQAIGIGFVDGDLHILYAR